MLNYVLLVYLLTTLVCIGVLVFVMIRQFKEVRRPKNAFTQLRWRLFWLPTVILFGLLLGLPRMFSTLHTPFSVGQIIRVLGGIIVLIGFTLLILGIYTFKEKR